MSPARPGPRQRGFVLITVFLVLLLLLSLGGAVLLSTQSDLQVAGYDREAAIALYAAEAGIAFGKDWLAGRVSGTGAGAWTVLLRSGDALLCAPGNGAAPKVLPKVTNPAVTGTSIRRPGAIPRTRTAWSRSSRMALGGATRPHT
jgi:Tfp pilus assembly protein PilX